MEAPRSAYMKSLLLRRHNGLIKIITGIRRCGKSYFLFKLFRDVLLSEGVPTDHIIALQLDDIRNRKYRNPEACYEYVLSRVKEEGPYYVLLDEVQMMDHFEEVMNSFLHVPSLDVYVTGSNSKFLSSDVVTEFRGMKYECILCLLRNSMSFRIGLLMNAGRSMNGTADCRGCFP